MQILLYVVGTALRVERTYLGGQLALGEDVALDWDELANGGGSAILGDARWEAERWAEGPSLAQQH